IVAEFSQLMSADLMRSFYSGLDVHLPNKILLWLDANDSHQNCFFKGMSKDSYSFLKLCEPTDKIEDFLRGIHMDILIVSEELREDVFPKEINEISPILEECQVLTDISDVPKAFGLLMGLLYASNIDYPKHI
ncbi:putative inositol hexakisphosphate and diphosphoinositol-pentakisphosphate kinase 2-like, partial [Triplophysa rosa]